MNYPKNLKYTKDHEWAKIEGKTAVIGITEHAQSALGDIVFVELPLVGRTLKAGETFGVVESIKAVSDLYAPLAGKVVAINESLSNDPAQINKDPQGSAWMIKIEAQDNDPGQGLIDASAYQQLVESLK